MPNSPTPALVQLAVNTVGRYSPVPTSGLGTDASPYLFNELAMAASFGSVRVEFTPQRRDGSNLPAVWGHTATIAVGLGQDGTQIDFGGATLKYVGSGTIQNQVQFSTPSNQGAAVERCEFSNCNLHLGSGTNQASRALYTKSAHHFRSRRLNIVGAGSNATDAFTIVASTETDADEWVCSQLVSSAATNFARGLVVTGLQHDVYGYVQTTISNIKCHVNGVKQESWYVDGTRTTTFRGSGENSQHGYNLIVSSNTTALTFRNCDWEGGAPGGYLGGNLGIHITGTNVRGISFIDSETIDGSITIDAGGVSNAGIGRIRFEGGNYYACTNSTSNGLTFDGTNIHPSSGNFGGTLVGCRFINDEAGNTDQFAAVKVSSVGATLTVENTDTTGASGVAVHLIDRRAGHVRDWLIGTGIDNANSLVLWNNTTGKEVFRAEEDDAAFVHGTPITPSTYTVATLPAGGNGRTVYVSNGRKIGEGAAAGTGVMAVYSNSQWRRVSDDAVVSA